MKKIFFIATALTFGLNIFAQSVAPEVVATAGDHYSNVQGSVSWTLGEIATETYSAAGKQLTQGFQQPHLIITGVKENLTSSKINVYPNPVKDLLVVDMNNLQSGTYSMELYDAAGKLVSKTIQEKGNAAQSVTIGMSGITNGMYYLNVINTTAAHKESYKINKAE
jgi:hypothetical protein